jgi:hypothetical protein
MKTLSRISFLFVLCTLYFVLHPSGAYAQEAFPKIKFPCDETNDPEFHSLRPYQAAVCGDADKALFCSNELKFIESFEMAYEGDCDEQLSSPGDRIFTCNPHYPVLAHDLYVELTESMFPIMGNTEQVKNYDKKDDEFDDAQKVNEYASWYLSGVNNKAEYGENTDEKIVNFSGPIQKLLPSIIQDAQRIKTIENVTKIVNSDDEETSEVEDPAPANHNQIVVCAKSNLGIIGDITGLGSFKPVECYDGNKSKANGTIFRLVRDKGGFVGAPDPKDCSYVCRVPESVECKRCLGEGLQPIVGGADSWEGDLSIWNNFIENIVGKIVDLLPLVPQEAIKESVLNHWNKRTPPLPWENDPFQNRPMTELEYKKYYNEWRGKTCVIIPLINSLFCFDNILVPNKYADLYQYIPLSNTTDKKGAEYIIDDEPQYIPTEGTKIGPVTTGKIKIPPLYFAHTEEVKELSNLLNKTYTPAKYESEPLPLTTETLPKVNGLDCSAVNVRTNQGDNLFPGDPGELLIPDVEYDITQATCHEHFEIIQKTCKDNKDKIIGLDRDCDEIIHTLECPAQITIKIPTGTKTPNADEIFSTTVADSGSTFRKIFPKVGEGAPVTCIGDIPAVTSVTYNAEESETPKGGSLEFGVKKIPEDGGGDTSELTFPHVGSVYEYFLKGIQTALRPKGYGEPITDGTLCKPTTTTCGEWEDKLEKTSGGDCGICTSGLGNLAKKILATAGKQYNVPAANIWAAMQHEGADWDEFRGQFTDENVRKWSTPIECGGEPMPKCDLNDKTSSKAYPPFGFLPYWFYKGEGEGAIWTAVQEFDPTRNSIETVSHCNFLDATFASAKSLATWSGFARTPASCYGQNLSSSIRPASCGSSAWTDAKVVQSQVGYWIGITPWCPDGTGGPSPLVNNIPIPDYASRVLSNFKSAKCN